MLAYSRKSKAVYYPGLDSASLPSSQASPPPASGILDPQENNMKSIVSEAEASPARKSQIQDVQPKAVENEEERIAQLAYALWQDRGCPIGSPEQDWIEAERQLRR